MQPGTSALRLLEGGPIAVAIAPAGLSNQADLTIATVAAVGEEGDPGTLETAESLAAALGAKVIHRGAARRGRPSSGRDRARRPAASP